MKVIIIQNSRWDDKVNFVDENNVALGYDMGQDCCEHADWFICSNACRTSALFEQHSNSKHTDGLESYTFDKNFHIVLEQMDDERDEAYGVLEDGGMAIFKVVSSCCFPDLYIHIYNSHNGYYGHGFDFCENEKTLLEGSL